MCRCTSSSRYGASPARIGSRRNTDMRRRGPCRACRHSMDYLKCYVLHQVRQSSLLRPEEPRKAGTVTGDPPVRRRVVGGALRRYRENVGYVLEDAARILECDTSKISRIEIGQRGIRPKELRELLTEYGVDPAAQDTLAAIASASIADGWWSDYRRVLPPGYLDFAVVESVAPRLRIYAPLQVPELLWTPDYGRAV